MRANFDFFKLLGYTKLKSGFYVFIKSVNEF